jgi:hypothetical protein
MSLWDTGSESSSATQFTSVTYDISAENIKKPPFWPLVVQLVAIFASLILFTLSPREKYLSLSLIGYGLTPFIVFASLALQRAKDLSARSNAFYDQALGKTYIRIAGILSVASFVVAIPIVYRLATEISQLA